MFRKNSYKRSFACLTALLTYSAAQAQSGIQSQEMLFIFVAAVLAFAMMAFLFMIYSMNAFLNQLQKEKWTGFSIKEAWQNLQRQMTGSVPIDQEQDVMTDHVYDGIIELDNRLPPWWVYMFYATIIFSFIYIGWYHIFDKGPLQEEEYKIAMAAAEERQQKNLQEAGEVIDENSVTVLIDEALVKEGKDIFESNCAACHGQEGQGTAIAPNLVDEYWLHGGGIKNTFKSIKYGIPEKGMISWQNSLSPSDIQKVASFIISSKGSNPPNAKEPQGEKWTEPAE